jgi:hypothetical protein
MNDLEEAVRRMLVFCCHEWFNIVGGGNPLDEPEQLGDVPAYFIPSQLIVAVAVAHDQFIRSRDNPAQQADGQVFPGAAVNLDTLPTEPDPG